MIKRWIITGDTRHPGPVSDRSNDQNRLLPKVWSKIEPLMILKG